MSRGDLLRLLGRTADVVGWEFDIASTDVMLVPGPTFHMSFSSLCLCAFYRGARIRIVERFDVPKSYEELRDNCSWSMLIPTMTMMLLELWRAAGRRPLPAARVLLSSGAALSPSTLEDMMQAFPNARIYEAYGWTEGGWVTSEIKQRGTVVPHSVGWSSTTRETSARPVRSTVTECVVVGQPDPRWGNAVVGRRGGAAGDAHPRRRTARLLPQPTCRL